MADTVATGRDLEDGGFVCKTSGGVEYCGFTSPSTGYVYIYKKSGGSWSEVAYATQIDLFASGGAGSIAWMDGAIDSNDDLIVVVCCATDQTQDNVSRYFDCATDSWLGTGWDEIENYDESAPANPYIAIAIDNSDNGHVIFKRIIKVKGVPCELPYYATGTPGAWGLSERCGGTDGDYAGALAICVQGATPSVSVLMNRGSTTAYRQKNGTWGTESATAGYDLGNVLHNGTAFRLWWTVLTELRRQFQDTGYDVKGSYVLVCDAGTTGADATEYCLYIDTSDDVHLISYEGSYTDEGTLQTGTHVRVVLGCSYYHHGWAADTFGYLFDDGTDLYYDEWPAEAAKIPRHPAAYFGGPTIF